MDLLAVGTVAFDTVQTPFGARTDTLGGSATFLTTSASFFTSPRLVGIVGQDFPDEHVQFLKSRNIDTSGLEIIEGRSFRWTGRYEHDLNVAHTLETQLNVLEKFNPKLPEHFCQSEIVALGNFDPELQLRVLEQVRDPKLVACDTMNFWIEGANAKLKETLKRVDLLSINDGEARMLSGEHNLVKAAKAIHAMGPRLLIIKRGEHGALLFHEHDIFVAPAYPLEDLCDPTGAGDSFAGGLLGLLSQQKDFDPKSLRQAVIMGSVMASFAVEDFSLDRFRTLKQNDIAMRFQKFKTLTHFDDSLDHFA